MRNQILTLSILTMIVATLGCSSNKLNALDKGNSKQVGHAKWHIQQDIQPEVLLNKDIPADSVSLFFLRPHDEDVEQTSANIGINDKFQVSLQPGHYTQVYSCSGINQLTAQATGYKTNDLLQNPSDFNLAPNQNYFFYIDVDTEGNSTIQQVEKSQALNYLSDKKYQTHQITRVIDNCPEAEPAPPAPPPQILEEVVTIELDVLFDNDKAIVKPAYINEVKKVADFMTKYGNTKAVIEGHTDSTASDSYNQKLSERRANAVKSMLVSEFGIAPQRVEAVGYGELRPRASNDTAEGRQSNRRVVAVIQERVQTVQ